MNEHEMNFYRAKSAAVGRHLNHLIFTLPPKPIELKENQYIQWKAKAVRKAASLLFRTLEGVLFFILKSQNLGQTFGHGAEKQIFYLVFK